MKDVSDAIWICWEKADLCDATVVFRVMKLRHLRQDPCLLLVPKKENIQCFQMETDSRKQRISLMLVVFPLGSTNPRCSWTT